MKRVVRLALGAAMIGGLGGGVWSCSGSGGASATPHGGKPRETAVTVAAPTMADQKPREYPGIHNAVAYHEGFVSGSAPEGEEGFETLRAMGVKTIISVDGAEPEAAKARAHGMRYIHLPIGYNGFTEERRVELARAARDAMADGPVYIHCHHGKHRSAGAAAAVAASLGLETPDTGVERMRVSGTAPNYKGLYACAAGATALSAATIDSAPAEYPEVWAPSGYVKGMVEIDEVFEHLKEIEKAGWTTPADHPDLVPVAEAGRLADLFRVLAAGEYVKRKPAELAGLMKQAQDEAQRLEDRLAVNGTDGTDAAAAGSLFSMVAASCKDCHAKWRDAPTQSATK